MRCDLEIKARKALQRENRRPADRFLEDPQTAMIL
jgi:hypothetical protein